MHAMYMAANVDAAAPPKPHLPHSCCALQDLKPEDYTYQLTPEEVAEIIAGTEAILAKGVKDEEDIKKVRAGWHDLCRLLVKPMLLRACAIAGRA